MENVGKKVGQLVGEFINAHPWITMWTITGVTSTVVNGLVTLIRGHKPTSVVIPESLATYLKGAIPTKSEEQTVEEAEEKED